MSIFRRLLARLSKPAPAVAPSPADSSGAPAGDRAAHAVNALGLDLLAQLAPSGNALLSPFSIQSALAMTYAGADGVTRDEMQRVLHFPTDEAQLHAAFAALHGSLEAIAEQTAARALMAKECGGPSEPVTLTVANRLFAQTSFEFRRGFLELLRERYVAPLQPVDFQADPEGAREEINGWVERRTRSRIQNLLPELSPMARLVLVNAIYLKAPWAVEFPEDATELRPFHVEGAAAQKRPTMLRQGQFGYRKMAGFSAVTVPYSGAELHLLVLVPDTVDGVAAIEKSLDAAVLAECAGAPTTEVILYLPKLELELPLSSLGEALIALGMKTAFDVPTGSANFERMVSRRGDDSVYLSKVYHKTFLSLDERGTEASAATAVVMMFQGLAAPTKTPKPVALKVDRPFVFAIQHRASGACLFLGRVSDPR